LVELTIKSAYDHLAVRTYSLARLVQNQEPIPLFSPDQAPGAAATEAMTVAKSVAEKNFIVRELEEVELGEEK
jgi:hypothetical protein